VLLLVSEQPEAIKILGIALLSGGALIFSKVTFARCCITRALLAEKLASERAHQKYFLHRYGNLIEPYTAVSLDISAPYQWWSKRVFARASRYMFYLWAFLIACLAATTSAVLLYFWQVQNNIPLVFMGDIHVYLAVAMISFAFSLLAGLAMLWIYQYQAEIRAKEAIGRTIDLVSESLYVI